MEGGGVDVEGVERANPLPTAASWRIRDIGSAAQLGRHWTRRGVGEIFVQPINYPVRIWYWYSDIVMEPF